MKALRVALIGYGAMGRIVARALAAGVDGVQAGAVLLKRRSPASHTGLASFHDVGELLEWKPDLVVECAGQSAVADTVPRLLTAGVDVVLASIGALVDPALLAALEAAAIAGGARVLLASGAIGGLDALAAAGPGALEYVRYTGTKPALAWAGAPGATAFDLGALRQPTTIFSGNALEAARLFPRNANVAASVGLAGVGLTRTEVRLVADPGGNANRHAIDATGTFGCMRMEMENAPLPDNPRTSALAAHSLLQAIRRRTRAVSF